MRRFVLVFKVSFKSILRIWPKIKDPIKRGLALLGEWGQPKNSPWGESKERFNKIITF